MFNPSWTTSHPAHGASIEWISLVFEHALGNVVKNNRPRSLSGLQVIASPPVLPGDSRVLLTDHGSGQSCGGHQMGLTLKIRAHHTTFLAARGSRRIHTHRSLSPCTCAPTKPAKSSALYLRICHLIQHPASYRNRRPICVSCASVNITNVSAHLVQASGGRTLCDLVVPPGMRRDRRKHELVSTESGVMPAM